jgi:hypothetical protein
MKLLISAFALCVLTAGAAYAEDAAATTGPVQLTNEQLDQVRAGGAKLGTSVDIEAGVGDVTGFGAKLGVSADIEA